VGVGPTWPLTVCYELYEAPGQDDCCASAHITHAARPPSDPVPEKHVGHVGVSGQKTQAAAS